MILKKILNKIQIGSQTLSLRLEEFTPVAEFKKQNFKHLWGLIEACPELSELSYLEEFALISNFFWKADTFQYIDVIAEYQDFYSKRVHLEMQKRDNVEDYRLTDFKIFDVSGMHPPKVIDNQLIYFTFNKASRLPYRVVCPFPYPIQSTYVHYQILPTLSSET